MAKVKSISRRSALKATAAAAGAAALPLVNVRTASGATTLTLGIWDHWVKTANPVMHSIIEEWGKKNNVNVKIDFITSVGNKMILTQAAEAQAGSGHDIVSFDQWNTQRYADKLVPVDDVVEPLIKKYGPLSKAMEVLGKANGKWMGVPMAWGTAPLPTCARISMFKSDANEDVTAWYPAKPEKTAGAEAWTYEKQLKIAEACHKAGHTFGLGCGSNSTDANQTWGATFGAFGADLVNAKGDIIVDSDPVREVLDYVQRFVPYLPKETISYDDAANNRALISGSAAMIWNPPSAWAVAKRDNPKLASDLWTFPNPKGKKGRLVPHRPYLWGIWKFAKNQSAAKDLMTHLSQREVVEKLSIPAAGYDIPPFLSMSDLPVWADTEPPKGTLYNYPVKPHHDAEYYIVGTGAPPEIALQIWGRYIIPSMVARTVQGWDAKRVIAWAANELEGARR
ncbi:MAG: extracellular solute-binding protein [Hyphomicrobiaceae bacterium]